MTCGFFKILIWLFWSSLFAMNHVGLTVVGQNESRRCVSCRVSCDAWGHGLVRVDVDRWHYYIPVIPSDKQ